MNFLFNISFLFSWWVFPFSNWWEMKGYLEDCSLFSKNSPSEHSHEHKWTIFSNKKCQMNNMLWLTNMDEGTMYLQCKLCNCSNVKDCYNGVTTLSWSRHFNCCRNCTGAFVHQPNWKNKLHFESWPRCYWMHEHCYS